MVGVDRPRGDEPRHRPRRLLGRHTEQAGEQPLGREHRAARVALDHARERGVAGHPPAGGDRLREPGLDQLPAVREGRLVALLALDEPEPLLQLRHRALELARLRRLEHEHVGPQASRVLRMLADHRVHDPARRVRQSAGLVLHAVVARPLPAAGQRVEGGEEVERHQERPALQELPVVHALARRQRVLEIPRQADAGVVVRAPGPARIRPAGHRLPKARHTLREAIERRREPHVVDERERGALAADAERWARARSCGVGPGHRLIDHISVAVVKCAA